MSAEEEDGRKGSSFFLWRRGSVGKRMMLEMEKRDNKVAAEMGIKNHQP